PDFERLIWAPKVLPTLDPSSEPVKPRDPLAVMSRYDECIATDQIDGDTASRFIEFILQRMQILRNPPSLSSTVYLIAAEADRPIAQTLSNELRSLHVETYICPGDNEGTPSEIADAEDALLASADYVVLCCKSASKARVTAMLMSPRLRQWQRGRGSC